MRFTTPDMIVIGVIAAISVFNLIQSVVNHFDLRRLASILNALEIKVAKLEGKKGE